MITFKEFCRRTIENEYSNFNVSAVNEAPMAVLDDWEGAKIKLGHISKRVIPKYWHKLYEDKNVFVFIVDNKSRVILVKDTGDDKNYTIISELSVSERPDSFRLKPKTVSVNGVKTALEQRGNGYGTILYTSLLDNGYTILSDSVQYNGARMLYQKLYDTKKYQIDIWDEKEKEIIYKDAEINHGKEDWEIDGEHWSFDHSKRNWKFLVYKK